MWHLGGLRLQGDTFSNLPERTLKFCHCVITACRMPTALFIPEEHNCCYRYSYSGALQTPAALPQLIIWCSIRTINLHTHTHTHTLWATFGPHHPPSKNFLYLSQWWAATGSQFWRAHLPQRAACQQALTHTRYITTEPVPIPAPNHYAHNHLRGKENVDYHCRMSVTGAQSPPSALQNKQIKRDGLMLKSGFFFISWSEMSFKK